MTPSDRVSSWDCDVNYLVGVAGRGRLLGRAGGRALLWRHVACVLCG
jgi:hypothetical protein